MTRVAQSVAYAQKLERTNTAQGVVAADKLEMTWGGVPYELGMTLSVQWAYAELIVKMTRNELRYWNLAS